MLAIGAVASVIGIARRAADRLVPDRGLRRRRNKIDTLWDVLLIASVPVFVLVEVVVLYCVVRFRMRPGEELKDGPPIHGNTTARDRLDRDPGDPARRRCAPTPTSC